MSDAAAPPLVFSHANGFPAPIYRTLLAPLRAHFAVSHVLRFGHAPEYPVARGWDGLVRELLDHVAALPAGSRPWLVGHSLGGYLSVLAADRLGTRVAGVVLLDSPIIGAFPERVVKLGRRLGFDRLLMPLRQTLQRRVRWPDVDAAHRHFAAKPGFARWDAQALQDYAEHGTVAGDDGARALLFERDVEHRIYDTLPTSTVRAAAQRLQVPLAFVGGTRSRELRYIGVAATRRRVGARLRWIEGGHLFPMEQPEATATAILELIDAMDADASAR